MLWLAGKNEANTNYVRSNQQRMIKKKAHSAFWKSTFWGKLCISWTWEAQSQVVCKDCLTSRGILTKHLLLYINNRMWPFPVIANTNTSCSSNRWESHSVYKHSWFGFGKQDGLGYKQTILRPRCHDIILESYNYSLLPFLLKIMHLFKSFNHPKTPS